MGKEIKPLKYRIGAYVEKETWVAITDYQTRIKDETGKKPTQGQVLDMLLSEWKKKN